MGLVKAFIFQCLGVFFTYIWLCIWGFHGNTG